MEYIQICDELGFKYKTISSCCDEADLAKCIFMLKMKSIFKGENLASGIGSKNTWRELRGEFTFPTSSYSYAGDWIKSSEEIEIKTEYSCWYIPGYLEAVGKVLTQATLFVRVHIQAV